MGLPVMIAMGVVQAGIAIGGAIAQGEENRRAQEANDAELQRAARLAAANAVAEEARAGQAQGRARSYGSAVVEAQKLAFNASGVDANSGTPGNLEAGTRAAAEMQAQAIEVESAQRALGHREMARGYNVQRAEGQRRYDASQGLLAFQAVGGATTSILGGVASGLSYAKK